MRINQPKTRKPRIAAEDFIRALVEKKYDVVATAEYLDLSVPQARAKIHFYRKRGVKIPKLGKRLSNVNVDKLNAIIKGRESV